MTKRSEQDAATRRTTNVRPMGRAARVVAAVLKATAQQLNRVGYAALRVEEVAEASGVNKTTIYRRWPTKPDLVIAALRELKVPATPAEVGEIRADVLAAIHHQLAFAGSPVGKGLVRMVLAERGHPEVAAISKALRKEQRLLRAGLVARAVERGDLPADTDAELVADMLFVPIFTRAITYGERLPDGYVEKAVDLVLAGARARASAGRKLPERDRARSAKSGARRPKAVDRRPGTGAFH